MRTSTLVAIVLVAILVLGLLCEHFATAISAVGEFLIAFVIYLEVEAARVDKFLEDADNNSNRKEIYRQYCGISAAEFKEKLGQPGKEGDDLRDLCHNNIRIVSRMGARLPLLPELRNRVLDWHVVVFLWAILGPYVKEKRKESGHTYAETFLTYALASVNRLLLTHKGREQWTIQDPDFRRKKDIVLTRKQMEEMREDLERNLDNN